MADAGQTESPGIQPVEIAGNRLTLLPDGPERLEALIDLIDGASESLRLLYYIWCDDPVGRRHQAQLVLDVSALRKATPPDWCGPNLAIQLATALRDEHYVPLAVQVKPADATVEILRMRTTVVRFRELPLVWLPPGTYDVRAIAGERSAQVAVLVAPPASSIAVDASEPVVAPPPPDAGPTAPPVPIDAGVDEVAPPIDADT